MEDGGDDAGGDDDAGRGQNGDAGDGLAELANVDTEGGVENQARQQDDEHDFGADLEVLVPEYLGGDQPENDEGDGVGDGDEADDEGGDDRDRHQGDGDFDGVESEHALHSGAF